MDGLSDEEKKAFKEQNQTVVTEHFIPAYKTLLEGLEALKGTGTNAEGICQFPDGKLYYQYLVDSSIGPTYETMDDLQKAIKDQIDDSLSAMSQIMKQNPEIGDELDQFHFSESDPEKILELLKGAVNEDFPAIDSYEYVTKYMPCNRNSERKKAIREMPTMSIIIKPRVRISLKVCGRNSAKNR